MKTLKWFKEGEPIPDDAKYIKSENKIVRYEFDEDPMGRCDYPVKEEFHLYEVPIKEFASD